MSDIEIIEEEATQVHHEIVPMNDRPSDLAVMPVIDLRTAKERYSSMVQFVREIMREDVDYGVIPGTAKPTLYKPGAEKLATFFGLRKTFEALDKTENWDEKNPFFFYRYKVCLWRSDWLIAEGIGSASSMEDRYRWRWVSYEKIPPHLDHDTLERRGGKITEFDFSIKEGRTQGDYAKPAEYWEKFRSAIADGSARQTTKTARSGKAYPAWEIDAFYYRIPNPDVYTLVNTIDKMAQKRAFIQAVLLGVNASEFFTQDIEDLPVEAINGEIDNRTPIPHYAEPDEIKAKAEDAINALFDEPKPKAETKPDVKRPYPPDVARDRILSLVDKFKGVRKDEKRGKDLTLVSFVAWQLNECFPGPAADKKRISVVRYIFGDQIESLNDLTGGQLKSLEKWLDPKSEGPGAGLIPCKEAQMEAASIWATYLKSKGQQELPK